MIDLRSAAQQALEALKMMRDRYEEYACPACDHADAAIYALKEALVEDAMQKFTDVNQELMAALGCDHCNSPLYAAVKCRVCGRVTKPAPPQRKPEPNSDYERGFVDGMSEQARRSVDKAVNAMTNCKPLAEEEIARLVTNDMVKFARAIERAHGIGDNT